MSRELVLKKCMKCGAFVKVIKDCKCDNCGIKCCGEQMQELVPNSVDATVEKHVPTYKINGDMIEVKVNHVMEEEHYIEWVAIVSEKRECIKYFNPGDACEVHFRYVPNSTLYAFCNKHGLWKNEI